MPAYVTNNAPSSSEAEKAFKSNAKSEDVIMGDATGQLLDIPEEFKAKFYKIYDYATDIQYLPEDALKEGLGMTKSLKENVKKLELGSKLRKDVWLREIARLVLMSDITSDVSINLPAVFRTTRLPRQ